MAPAVDPVPDDGTEVLGPADIARALTRIAHEILERNKGARIIVEYVSDPELSARLREENKDKGAAPTTIFTKIVKVLPIG